MRRHQPLTLRRNLRPRPVHRTELLLALLHLALQRLHLRPKRRQLSRQRVPFGPCARERLTLLPQLCDRLVAPLQLLHQARRGLLAAPLRLRRLLHQRIARLGLLPQLRVAVRQLVLQRAQPRHRCLVLLRTHHQLVPLALEPRTRRLQVCDLRIPRRQLCRQPVALLRELRRPLLVAGRLRSLLLLQLCLLRPNRLLLPRHLVVPALQRGRRRHELTVARCKLRPLLLQVALEPPQLIVVARQPRGPLLRLLPLRLERLLARRQRLALLRQTSQLLCIRPSARARRFLLLAAGRQRSLQVALPRRQLRPPLGKLALLAIELLLQRPHPLRRLARRRRLLGASRDRPAHQLDDEVVPSARHIVQHARAKGQHQPLRVALPVGLTLQLQRRNPDAVGLRKRQRTGRRAPRDIHKEPQRAPQRKDRIGRRLVAPNPDDRLVRRMPQLHRRQVVHLRGGRRRGARKQREG